MPGDASDSSDDSDAKTNEKACTVKHQITNGKSDVSFVITHVVNTAQPLYTVIIICEGPQDQPTLSLIHIEM